MNRRSLVKGGCALAVSLVLPTRMVDAIAGEGKTMSAGMMPVGRFEPDGYSNVVSDAALEAAIRPYVDAVVFAATPGSVHRSKAMWGVQRSRTDTAEFWCGDEYLGTASFTWGFDEFGGFVMCSFAEGQADD